MKITRDPVIVLDELAMKHPYMVVISEAARAYYLWIIALVFGLIEYALDVILKI